jgi:nucleoid DNA-binding protein
MLKGAAMLFNIEWSIIAVLTTACLVFVWMLCRKNVHRSSASQDLPIVVESRLAPAGHYKDQLVEQDLQADFIQVFPVAEISQSQKLEVAEPIRIALQSVIQRSPAIHQIGKQMSDKGLRVVFSKEITRSLHTGDAALVKDAAGNFLAKARDAKTGRFLETGKTIAQGGIKAAQVTAMAWQIASIATAQHYLGEINEKLQSIEDGIRDVLFLLKQEKQSAIKGSIDLLRQYHNALRQGGLAKEDFPVIRQKIEDIEEKCLEIADLGKAELSEKQRQLEQIKVHDWFGRAATAKRAKTLIHETSKAMQLVLMAHACRVMACQVRGALPNGHALVNERLEHAKTEVQETAFVLETAKKDFLRRLKGLKVRRDKLLALRGILDDDHHKAVSEEYKRAQHQAEATRDMLLQQANNASNFSAALDQIIHNGMSVDVVVTATGDLRVLNVGSAA